MKSDLFAFDRALERLAVLALALILTARYCA